MRRKTKGSLDQQISTTLYALSILTLLPRKGCRKSNKGGRCHRADKKASTYKKYFRKTLSPNPCFDASEIIDLFSIAILYLSDNCILTVAEDGNGFLITVVSPWLILVVLAYPSDFPPLMVS
jgi:hypothetical protein